MKKFLPIILLFAGVVVLVAVFLVVKGKDKKLENNTPKEEIALLELSPEESPVVSLTPTSDGHYLNLKVEKIGFKPFSLDYELLYQVPGGVQQGVPGTVNLGGKNDFEAELLLGSESSGKFRYDEGVEEGTISLRFRNDEGQLLARFTTEFHLQTATDLLTSLDGKFEYQLEEESDDYFVTMNTIGLPNTPPGKMLTLAYGVFSFSDDAYPGIVKIESAEMYWRWSDSREIKDIPNDHGSMPDIGIFIGLNKENEYWPEISGD